MAPARILVIEDNDTVRKLVVGVLAREAYDVAAACDAEAGHAMLAEVLADVLPDLVIMDRQLPGMDGLTLTRIIKTDPRTQRVPVLVFSANDTREDDAEAVAAGCDGFLAKPLDIAAFLRTVAWYVAVRRIRLDARTTLQPTKFVAASFRRPLGAAQCRAAHVPPALSLAGCLINPVSETL